MGNRPTGTVLVERYQIMERVGESPDGGLYRIKDIHSGEPFILKEMKARRLMRMHSTPQASALHPDLVHPNLPRVYDQFESDGCHCLILTNVGNVSLLQTVLEQGPCSEEQVQWVANAVCSALAYLHGHTPPIIFRHLRPANLFLDDNGQVILLDAGTGEWSGARNEPANRTVVRASRRRTVDALPTDGFAPPEPNRGSDAAGDIYALGATLYYLLTAATPPPSAEMVLGQQQIQPLRELRPDISPHLLGAVERMMALDHADRPASIETVAVLLGLENATTRPGPVAENLNTLEPASSGTQFTPGLLDRSLRTRRLGEVLNDRYHIDQILGRGGMGAVYLATHLELEEPVAIKEMLPPMADPETIEDCIRQFRIEARILNRLRHPNLPRVYDFFETDGRHYLVMDYIRGVTLEKAPTPSEEKALWWATALCDVLSYLHRQDPPVIFRDLKPANIMLDDDGTVRLIDFGIAKVFEPDEGASTKTILQGAVSHGYAAPEQYGGGTDERVDVYALGATLYFLLTRQVPPASMELALGQSVLTPLRELRPDVSEKLATALDWMMAVLREDRPRTMEEARHALGLSDKAPEAHVDDSVPARVKRLLREEFQYFFPAPWLPRPGLLDTVMEHLTPDNDTPVVCLQGEAGVGKSRLLEAVGDAVKDRMYRLPPIQGSRATRQQPFGALVGPLRELFRAGGETLLAALASRLDEVSLHEMAQLVPEMRSIDVAAHLPMVAPLERTRLLLDGFRVLLEQVSDHRRLLVVLDDIQWMDSGTLRLVDAMLSSDPDALTVAILAARQTKVEATSVDEAMHRWGRRTRIVEVTVPVLSRLEMRTYLEQTLPPVDRLDKHADALHAMTAGNVLLLEELIRWTVVRHLFEDRKGALALRDLQADLLPDGVEDSVRRRLEMLPLDSQELLAVASVVGQYFDSATLARLSAEKPQVVEESLHRAHEAYFIRPLGNDLWLFVSEATREACYARLSASHRRQLHLAMGRFEEERTASSPTASYHYEQAGDVAKSLEHLSRFSKEFLAPTTVEIVLRDRPEPKKWSNAADLSDPQVTRLKQAMAYLTRAIKSTSSYGAHSPIAHTSIEMGFTVLSELLKEIGPLVITCTETFYALNNRELDPRDAPSDLAATFRRHKTSGVEIQPSIDSGQLTSLLDLLSGSHDVVGRDGGWGKALAARKVTTVQLIESVMVEVSERDLFDPTRLRQAQEIVMRGEPNPAFTFDKMKPEPTTLPPAPVAVEDDAPLVTARDVGVQLDSIKGLLEELQQQNAAVRQQTGETLQLQTFSDEKELQDAWDSLNKQAQREEIFRLAMLARSVHLPLVNYLEQRPDLLIRELESEPREQRLLAAMGLLQHGQRSRTLLLRYLAESDNPRGRAAALFLLSQMIRDLGAHIIHRLVESTTEGEVIRLLRALQEAHLPWLRPLQVLLHSSSSAVRRAVGRMVVETTLLEPREKVEALREVLQTGNPPVVLDTLLVMAELKRSEMVPDIARILDKSWAKGATEAIRAQVQACYTLARIGNTATALPILRVIVYKGLQAALLGSWDSDVRAAATWALGLLPCEETRELLIQLTRDSDPAVRGAALLALDTPPPEGGARQVNRKLVEEQLP